MPDAPITVEFVGRVEHSRADEPGETHFLHPTDPAKRWCGMPAGDHLRPCYSLHEVTCVVCADLFLTLGMSGWLDGAA